MLQLYIVCDYNCKILRCENHFVSGHDTAEGRFSPIYLSRPYSPENGDSVKDDLLFVTQTSSTYPREAIFLLRSGKYK